MYHTSRRSWTSQTLAKTQALGSLLVDSTMETFGLALNDLTFPPQRWEAWLTALSGLVHAKDYVRAPVHTTLGAGMRCTVIKNVYCLPAS
jgi:hypothetical protein